MDCFLGVILQPELGLRETAYVNLQFNSRVLCSCTTTATVGTLNAQMCKSPSDDKHPGGKTVTGLYLREKSCEAGFTGLELAVFFTYTHTIHTQNDG